MAAFARPLRWLSGWMVLFLPNARARSSSPKSDLGSRISVGGNWHYKKGVRANGSLRQTDVLTCRALRGHPLKTSTKFSDFLTPTPCPHLDLIYTMRFTQPPLLRQLFHDLPFPLGCVHLIWMHPKDDSRGRGDLDDSEVIHWRCQNNLYPF